MDSWTATHTPSPAIKFENSPTESLLSTPGEMYPSLFGAESSPAPIDMMTPESHSEDDEIKMLVGLTNALAEPQTHADRSASVSSATPEPEKKPVKKRKSWGQVLPEPKTNLPPRKRAKTEDEKEQRRVERVLRNRRAAQSSRERKRLEVEGLEKRNKELEVALLKAQQTNSALLEQLKRLNPGGSTRSPSTFDGGLTFSHELFSSHDIQSNTTVDPSAISPTLAPIPEVDNENGDANLVANSNPAPVNASPDSAQHPAAMLSSDLPCQLAEASPSPWMEQSQLRLHPLLPLYLQSQLLLALTSAMLSLCQRPLMQIAMSLKAGFSLPPTPSLLNTIVWLVTTPATSRSTRIGLNSTSTTSSTTATSMSQPTTNSSRSSIPTVARSQTRLTSTLRHRLLRKILTCSPILARPLMDATMEALRWASSKSHTVDRVGDKTVAAAADGKTQQQQERGVPANWLPGVALPSEEVLITILWTLTVEERSLQIRQQAMSSTEQPGRMCVSKTPTSSSIIIIKKQQPYSNNSKRAMPEAEDRRQDLRDSKRRRF
ncbi:putative transcriptional activator [Cladorrhinum sp. PSN259]|nr:putative transcriptional activator [Cladorrhinum sp. PSN259]